MLEADCCVYANLEESISVGQKAKTKVKSVLFIFPHQEVKKVDVNIKYNLVFRYLMQNTRKQEIDLSNFVKFL